MGKFDDFFSTVESGAISEDQLQKALTAGFGTDSSKFTGGRAITVEDIESTMINVLEEAKEDCKIMNMLKTRSVGSTVHQYSTRTDVGAYEDLAVGEGEGSETSDQDIQRKVRLIKFLQDRRAVTDVMAQVNTFEDAFQSEKMAGTLNVLKAAESLCIHGDSDVIPVQFDGFIKQISTAKNPNIYDARGKTIKTLGEKIFTEPSRQVYERGGDANKMFMPPILANDIQELVKERIRFGTSGSGAMSLVVDQYPTPYGSTIHFGQTEGADKLFKVKGIVVPRGLGRPKRPKTPANVTATTSSDSNSKFGASDAGNYKYTVYAINGQGVSAGKDLATVCAVSAGNKVTLTITADPDSLETGYIIARSNKDGSIVMEMARIAREEGSLTTTFEDLNLDLPGTAQMIFITEKKIQTVVEWLQLLPLRIRPLSEYNRAETPFFVQLYGSLDVKAPEWCAIVKNIQYQGGLEY